MRKHKAKKYAVLMSTLMTAMLAVTGCGKRKVDLSFDDENGGSSSGTLASKLGVPESCEMDIDVGDSGLTSIKIDAESISVPDTDSMSIYEYAIPEYGNEYKKSVCESIFDKDQGIYVHDWEHEYVDDIQYQMNQYEKMLDAATAAGDTEEIEWINSYIDMLDEEMANAAEEKIGAGDYEDDSFLGMIGDQQFLIGFYTEDYSEDYSGIITDVELNAYPYDSILENSSNPDACSLSYYSAMVYDDEEIVNTCQTSKDDCIEIARNFLSDIGADNLVVSEVDVVVWDYLDYNYETIDSEYNGYAIVFSRGVGDEPVFSAPLYNVDYLWNDISFDGSEIGSDTVSAVASDSTEDNPISAYPAETYTVYVTDMGVIYASCEGMSVATDNQQKNVELMTWDEMIESVKKSMPEFFAQYQSSYNEVNFTDVKLTYYRIPSTENPGTLSIVPVWSFTEYQEYDYGDDGGSYGKYAIQEFMINAVDGSVIVPSVH